MLALAEWVWRSTHNGTSPDKLRREHESGVILDRVGKGGMISQAKFVDYYCALRRIEGFESSPWPQEGSPSDIPLFLLCMANNSYHSERDAHNDIVIALVHCGRRVGGGGSCRSAI